jgi:SAM-dependent methyltransferase
MKLSTAQLPQVPVQAPTSTRKMYGDRLMESEEGYDLVAPVYDRWHWQEFWVRNELPRLHPLLQREAAQGPILDVGCGTGTYLAALSQPTSVGVDPSASMLAQARRKVPRGVSLLRGRAGQLPPLDARFRACLTTRSLSHEPNLARAAQSLGAVTMAGGAWFISEVHPEHDYTCTRIPFGDEDIHVATYKHSLDDVGRAITSSGLWRIDGTLELRWADLAWKPTSSLFARIDRSGARPICYLMVLRRLAPAPQR